MDEGSQMFSQRNHPYCDLLEFMAKINFFSQFTKNNHYIRKIIIAFVDHYE